MQAFDIKLIFVFDGARLPAKKDTESKRHNNRQEKKKEAEKLYKQGNYEAANKKFLECVDITPMHAYALIQYLKTEKIEYYVAPYEADAQLAYLYKQNLIDLVITEDSDLLAFGVKRVIFRKMSYGNLLKNRFYKFIYFK